MSFITKLPTLNETQLTLAESYRMKEQKRVQFLIEKAALSETQYRAVKEKALTFVAHVRAERLNASGIDSFLNQYALSTNEGIALMCLAESLLRVPDKKTIDELIKDKLTGLDWQAHKGQSKSFFVNAATWALMLTGKVLTPSEQRSSVFSNSLSTVVSRTGEPVIRKAVEQAMRIMSKQFVMGRNINEAIKRAKSLEEKGYRYSYDMLGEAAYTQDDADRYLASYKEAIVCIGQATQGQDVYKSAGVSVKLSALHPRYEVAKRERVLQELSASLLELCELAKEHNIALTVDAEESERLELSLEIMERVLASSTLKDWNGFGLALQSYQKRAFDLIDWVAETARATNKRIMVRLIKGAYWDSEIKKAQMEGLSDYPVFTRKAFTDVSFQACAKKILGLTDEIYPQFATHNAYSVALILELAGEYRDFEFQCLHGMGVELYDQITPVEAMNIPCRIYAPVGTHEDLLPYLVRRLLENGANSSFVNRIVDDKAPIESLVEAPVEAAQSLLDKINDNIPLPRDIFGSTRVNAKGVDIHSYQSLNELTEALNQFAKKDYQSSATFAGKIKQKGLAITSPNDASDVVGEVFEANEALLEEALSRAKENQNAWAITAVDARANLLLACANALEDNEHELLMLLMREAGKTLNDAVAEVREAVDFCRYYAREAKEKLCDPILFGGYTGESNALIYQGRGPMLCISPWNFPLAIFTGQIMACLVAGNVVLAKPAEQTPLIAARALELFHQAGIPKEVLQLLPGDGLKVAAPMVSDSRIKGVLFTGSTATAKHIQRSLAAREGEIVPLVAETGGQNAMIVDSSALLEQVVSDVIMSAFGSCGQRCSALRVLFMQKDVYPRFKELLQGAMAELSVDNSLHYSSDVGPVIDADAQSMINEHISRMNREATLIAKVQPETQKGSFVTPHAFELKNINQLTHEIFGPILHVIPFDKNKLDVVIDEINDTGFGLTLGVHSRIEETCEYIASAVHVGNCYVNRNMTGAVVGLQPFGGQGLSGTGPKAGGPNYLLNLCHEKTITIDTTAAGGNASLMSQD